MANEAILIHETEAPIPMTCAEDAGIAKGALLILANPMTVTTHAANDEALFAGIAAEEKIADDGKTKIAVYMGGVFLLTGSAAFSAGETLALSATAQRVKKTDATTLAGKSFALALEDCGANAETAVCRIYPGIGGSLGLS
jgi:hypothetical protein